MAIENTVSIDFLSTFLDSIGAFDCRLPGVRTPAAEYKNQQNDLCFQQSK